MTEHKIVECVKGKDAEWFAMVEPALSHPYCRVTYLSETVVARHRTVSVRAIPARGGRSIVTLPTAPYQDQIWVEPATKNVEQKG